MRSIDVRVEPTVRLVHEGEGVEYTMTCISFLTSALASSHERGMAGYCVNDAMPRMAVRQLATQYLPIQWFE